jgi:hypothetical protein
VHSSCSSCSCPRPCPCRPLLVACNLLRPSPQAPHCHACSRSRPEPPLQPSVAGSSRGEGGHVGRWLEWLWGLGAGGTGYPVGSAGGLIRHGVGVLLLRSSCAVHSSCSSCSCPRPCPCRPLLVACFARRPRPRTATHVRVRALNRPFSRWEPGRRGACGSVARGSGGWGREALAIQWGRLPFFF